MKLSKYLFGINKEYLNTTEQDISKRQILVYNILSIMLLTLVFIIFLSGIFYGVIIFGNWFYAIIMGIFLALICFVVLLLVLFLNMTTKYRSLYEMMTNMDSVFKKSDNINLSKMNDRELIEIVNIHKKEISNSSIESDPDPFHWSKIITSSIKVALILIISIVIANGIELYLFKGSINKSISIIKNSEQLNKSILKNNEKNDIIIYNKKYATAQWTYNMLDEKKDQPFHLINCYSILLSIDIMNMSMGKWKLFVDILFTLLFLSPYILVKKSIEYSGGVYQKEVALHNISTAHMFYLLTQRKCQGIKKEILEKFHYDKALNLNKNVL